MAKATPKKGRSSSRGRAAAAAAKPAKPAATPEPPKTPKTPKTPASPKHEMEFDEGTKVMARWPGTNLFFNAKVSFVRDDDNEYDVTFEDGTTFTLKAKDVKREVKPRKGTPSRSRSRGRSPARKPAAAATPAAATPKPAAKAPEPKTEATPTRISARIAAAKAKAAESADEEEAAKKAPAKAAAASGAKFKLCACLASLNFAWLGTLFFMALSPLILVSLHTLCSKGQCKPEIPNFPKDLKAYWDPQAFAAVFGFAFVLRLLSLLPVGRVVTSVSGHEVRLNGFVTLLTLLAAAPAVVYRKIDVSFVSDAYFHIMVSSLILAFVLSTVASVLAKFLGGAKGNVNPKGNTGNPIVDFYNGRELNPHFARADLKLQTFRFSIIGLAVLNVLLVLNSIKAGQVNPVVAVAAAFQVAYALDAMFFEEYYFFSFDAMNSGYGFSLVSSYHSFPFLPTLVTRYLIAKSPTMQWYYLVAIGLMNLVGYVIFRKTESQRCEASKDKSGAANLLNESQGFWNYVRHPNYLGEILIQWSWVLPAACTAGRVDLLIYYLPVFTTLMILCRCSQQNKRNEKKLGAAWNNYCKRVPSNLIPKVF